MAFNINLFQGALKLGGVRPNLFQVNITNPVNGAADAVTPFLVRGAQIPAATMGVIEQPYFGRMVKLAGNRSYAEWTTLIINDEDFAIRNAVENWSNAINSFQGNLRTLGAASPTLYKGTAQVTQFSKTGVPLRVYNFVGLWPLDVSAADMDWATNDAIQEFSVTWVYDYWEVSGGITGNAGGS
jgi:hypothetical protein